MSIIAPPGVYAGISVFAGDNGVDINAPGAKIVLRGLLINGQGGTLGINLTNAAELHIDGCSISSFLTVGIEAIAGKLYLHDTLIRNNGNAAVSLSAADAQIDRVRIETNGGGGISVSSTSRVSIRDSLIADNGFEGIAVDAGPLTRVDVDGTTISSNGNDGVNASSSISGHKAEITIARSTIARKGGSGVGAVASAGSVHVSVTDSTVTGNFSYGLIAASGATILASNNS